MKITTWCWFLNNGFSLSFNKETYSLSNGIETGYATALGWWVLYFTLFRKNK